MYLVDTNILIYHFAGSIPKQTQDAVNTIFCNHFNVSIITKMEFLGFKGHNDTSYQKASEFLGFARKIQLDDEVINKVIELRRNYTIKLPDAIIAATALTNNLTVVTRNSADFNQCGLKLYNPFEEI